MTDVRSAAPALRQSSEKPATTTSGYGMLLLLLVALVAVVAAITQIDRLPDWIVISWLIAPILVLLFVIGGFYLLQPNQAAVITLFGDYQGTDRTTGLRWAMPWLIKKKVSVRANNIISERIKVNDLRGNPIEMAAQVVWRVTDTAQALFDVDDYKAFVNVQIEAAVRTIGSSRWRRRWCGA